MVEPAADDDWERKEAIAAALVDFLEGWVVKELCLHFRVIAEGLYSETPEHRLASALLSAPGPLTLVEIAARCGVGKDMVYPDGRIRRAIERMQSGGLVVDMGSEGKPRYLLNRGDLRVRLFAKIFEERHGVDGLVDTTLWDGLGLSLRSGDQ